MSKRKHAIEAHFQRGVRLHRAGRLTDAEQVQPPLCRLGAGLQRVERIVRAGEKLPSFDPYVLLLSLPHLRGFPPVTTPYPRAEAELIAAWREKPGLDGRKIGIAWQGNIAQLAGALGRPVWAALQHVPDWRWQLGRADCPWCSWKRSPRGEWDDVFARMAAAVAGLVPA